jgi:hypothetical protein
MSTMSDDELRRHFDALREADLARVPAFAELSRRPSMAPRATRTGARWVLVGGLSAAAAAAMLAVHVHRRQETRWLQAAAEISNWQAPTDVLLEVSNRGVLAEPATFGASVLDSIIPPALQE